MTKHVPKTNPTPIVTLLPNCGAPVTPSDPLVGGGEPVMFSLVEDTKAASCRTKSKKQLKEVEDAQLAAHRSPVSFSFARNKNGSVNSIPLLLPSWMG